MSQFDASFVYIGPLSEEVIARHRQEVERSMRMPSALANAKLHAERELNRWVVSCNRLVWGAVPDQARQPSSEEISSLLEQLSPENRERLLNESKLAVEQRNLVALLMAAENDIQARLEAEELEEARRLAEAAEREEFEAIDAAGKEARFQAWRSRRSR